MIRTRFAPSPTGYLHIGGVRTALYNWLFARQHGGKFILRIDDTDEQRNVAAALQPILEGFRWLGLDWDEGAEVGGPYGPYHQSERKARYQEVVGQLLASGKAYWDYSTAEERAEEEKVARAAKQNYIYSRSWAAQTEADRARLSGEGRIGVVRLRMPRDGTCRFSDEVKGPVDVEWAREQDHVIQRADGSCLYNLATVVDDHDMLISHVIRAEEHLSNTARQIFIYEALGWTPPVFAHLPYVAEPGSKSKLSKRKLEQYLKNTGPGFKDFRRVYDHGRGVAERLGLAMAPETFNPVIVEFFEKVGYLPEAVLNAMLLVGWSLDDRTEMFPKDEMIKSFSLGRVTKAPASFDAGKLWAFQERYMQALPLAGKIAAVTPFLAAAKVEAAPARLRAVVEGIGNRLVTGGDILDFTGLLVDDQALTWDEAAFEKHVRAAPAPEALRAARAKLAAVETFDAATLGEALKEIAAAAGVGLGVIGQGLRVAVSGRAQGMGSGETLAVLGKASCLVRIDRALARV